MKPIYIFGRKRIWELENALDVQRDMIYTRDAVIREKNKKISDLESDLDNAMTSVLDLLAENRELKEQLSKFP